MITPPKARRFHGSVSESVKPGAGETRATPEAATDAAKEALPNAAQIRAEKLKRFTATEEIADGFEGMLPPAGPSPPTTPPRASWTPSWPPSAKRS